MADLKLNILMQAADKLSAPFRNAGKSSDKLKSALAEATGRVRDLEKTSGKLQAFRDLKASARQNASALNEAQSRAQKMAQEMASADKVTRKMRTEFNAARKEVLRLKSSESQIADATGNLRRELKSAGIDTKSLGSAQRKLKSDLDGARQAAEQQAAALDRARKKTNALAQARRKMEKTMQLQANMALGGAAGMAAGGGALALGAHMASAGIDFGEQMSGVAAVARIDKTSAAYARLKQEAEDLGASTQFSASQAAQGMQYLAMAGFNAQQMYQAMPGMLDLAKAGATDLATTADIASNVLSGFGMKADQMGHLGDVMTATFTRSNVDLQMLGDTMKYTAPIAKEFGASVEDVSAMSGLLGNVGIQGSQAGTALRALFSRMANPPKEARAALAQLGVATKDASGNARNMVDILSDVAKATQNMGSGDRLEAFTKIAGQEAGAAFATLVNSGGAGEITKFSGVLKKSFGEASQVAKQMGDNAAGDIKSFQSAVEGMNIALTDTNDAPLRGLIQSATGVVRSVTTWVKENPKLAGTLVKIAAAIAGVVFVGGALLTTVAGLLGPLAMARFAFTTLGINAGLFGKGLGLVGKGVGFLGNIAKIAFPIVSGGIRAISAAMAANPILAIIMAIAAAAFLLYEYWDPIKAFFVNLWSGIVDAFSVAWNWITDKLQALAAPIKWVADALGSLFGSDSKKELTIKNKGPSAKDTGNAIRKAASRPVRMAAVAPVAAALATSSGAAAGVAQTQAAQAPQSHYQIIINPPPGTDEQKIAKMVRAELDKRERQKASAARSALHDGVK